MISTDAPDPDSASCDGIARGLFLRVRLYPVPIHATPSHNTYSRQQEVESVVMI